MSAILRGDIERVAVIGTGTIGASWATTFIANGIDVIASDPAPGAEARLKEFLARALPDLSALGYDGEGCLSFVADPSEAVAGADFVQENTPEDETLKADLLARLDATAPPDIIIASSTTALLRSRITTGCAQPDRHIVAHPFNPPHLVPLVEITGPSPDAEAVTTARRFYRAIGKQVVTLKREAIGHLANRLTSALWREAVSIYQEGIADIADIDLAVTAGPGFRWAALGPYETYHLGGGAGGIEAYMRHLQPAQERRWADMKPPQMDDAFRAAIIEAVLARAAGRPLFELGAERDAKLRALSAALGYQKA